MWERIGAVWLVLVVAVAAAPALAGRDAARMHVFGNSLINHLSEADGDATTVPYWLGQLTRASGRDFALSGQWGFLRNFARDGAASNWSFKGVAAPRGRIDTVMINPANFIQYQPPDAPYEGDNPDGSSPLSATLAIIDRAQDDWPGARIVIYEGWPDMGGFGRSFPPSDRNLRRWHSYALGDYHDWYRAYVAQLQNARPETEITLAPVSSVLSGLLSGLLEDIPVEALFTDDAPHGTPTQYFLAALVTYTALFEAPAPAGFAVPEAIHPGVRNRYDRLTDEIAQALGLKDERAVAPATTQEARAGVGVANPSLAMGLNGIADWSSQHPFLNVMKSARPWIGHTSDEWGAFSTEALRTGGYLNEVGYPVALPDGAKSLESFLLTDQPAAATHLAGRYLLRYEGEGVLRVTGRADNVRYNYDTREIRFDFRPGDGPVVLRLLETSRDDPIRNISIVKQDHLALHEAGALFNPLWIDKIADLRMLRFMDWQFTNGSSQSTWEGRPRPEDATYVWRGAPVEVMVALANRIGADPWVNMPHAADDAYMHAFAEYMRDHLDPGLKAHVEYSNEVWNFIFPQAVWAREAAEALWEDAAGDDAWMQYAGLRVAQMATIWREVFEGQEDRLSVLVATHTGWPGLEEPMLNAPLALKHGQLSAAPVDHVDGYAVTGYFGFDLGAEEMAATVEGWITASRAVARAKAAETGSDPNVYLAAHEFDLAYDLAAEALRQGSLGELHTEVFPYHADLAARHDLPLMMYEGGTHVVGHGTTVENETLTAFFTGFNYSPQMGQLYEELLAGWQAAGGTAFNAFVDVATPSKWGSWGALRHLNDDTPRWRVLMAANTTPPDWAEPRISGAFLHGVTQQAGDEGTTLIGTAKADILLGGAGDDVLISHGGNDRLHGGAGRDLAILPGARTEYGIGRDGARVILQGLAGEITLVAIEAVEFGDAPGQQVTLGDLM
ncbi:hypothetical protein RA2_01767 [Roseovarius sp. A-2]|uniref:calcium-binding protein n=1 Tax=Roseovarius sp. A-2 TaxID=1570360 RepID=UPI0009B590F5|nr:calcium-binding protein [Roseovarius sp. A-2]GAW34715.1 hypothetical protein RA2_01767 [Roseovarius sp. A-2]